MHYGLTLVQVRTLAYANANNLKYPTSWNENKMAGKEWLDSYRRRNTNLSLRKAENTSAARSFAFNKTDFYENLEKLLLKHAFPANKIYNFDESGVSTVLNTPKVLAEKNVKQIPVVTENLKEESFMLVKFEKKKDCFTLYWKNSNQIQPRGI